MALEANSELDSLLIAPIKEVRISEVNDNRGLTLSRSFREFLVGERNLAPFERSKTGFIISIVLEEV